MAYVISDECVACGSCAAVCPAEAISEGDGKSKNGWLHVRYKGTTGYSYSGYLKEI